DRSRSSQPLRGQRVSTWRLAGQKPPATLPDGRVSAHQSNPVTPSQTGTQIDVPLLDPIVTSAYTTRNHGFMVFDTLFGQDSEFRAQPQMVDGFTTEPDGKTWRLTLRDGLKFHDGTPVLARDCVASINCWASGTRSASR
ncbi:MAG: hypothetical protein EON48_02405, partial [Acetobacteraceae bacterium]